MRLLLPPGTEVARKIPKNKFYEKLQAGSNLKELFVQQVESVTWAHKLSSKTVRLEAADGIEEIQIFKIELRQRNCSSDILRAIDRAIPYPILYVLKYEGEEKLAIAYKERSGSDENRAVIKSYYETEWAVAGGEAFEVLHGLDLKAVYEHLVRSIALKTDTSRQSEQGSLEALLKQKAHIEDLERECAQIESKMKKEKQFNRKVELNMLLQRKQLELKEALSHS